MKYIYIILIGLIGSSFSLKAQTYFLNGGSYTLGTNCYVLTNEAHNQKGNVWFAQKLDLRNSFDISFSMNFGRLDANGADGMAFILQNISTSTIGPTGGSFAYTGITPSFAVEFDDYQNTSVSDPVYDHIAIISDGSVDHAAATNLAGPVAATSTQANIEDSVDHNIRIMWNPANDSIHIYFDCELRIAAKVDILNKIFSGSPSVWWGFSGSTGGSMNKQAVCITQTATTIMRDTTKCISDTIQLSAPVGTNYAWTPATGVSNTTIANPLFYPSATTKYYVNYNDNCGLPQIDSAIITIAPLSVNLGPDTNLCFGNSITLNAGSSFSSYLWQDGSTAQTLIANSSGSYWVKVKSSSGCSASDTVAVSILPAISLSVTPAAPAICKGDSLTLTATGATTYIWSPGAGLSNTTSSLISAFPSATTNYKIIGTNASGCSDSIIYTVNVNPLPTIVASANTSVCIGSATTLSATGGTTYTWTPASSLSNPNINNPVATPTTPTTYTVLATDANGCKNTATTTVNVNSLPTVNTSPNIAICSGSSTHLTASAASTYSWSPAGAGLSNTNISNPIANPSATTTYTLNITDANGCTGSGSVTVTVNPLPVATVSPSSAICSGGTTQLSASGGTTYLWSPVTGLSNVNISNPIANPSSTTTYSIKVTDANGCSNTNSTTVTINPLPTISITPNSGICNGSNIQLSASGGTSYTWSPSTGLNNTAISNPIASPSNTTSYSVTVTDANGCTNNASTTISVNSLASVSVSPNAAICAGNNTQLTASSASTYSWSPAGAGLSNTNISNPIATPSATTTYTLNITDANGCTGSGSVTVTVNPLPVAIVSPSSAICSGGTTQLSASGGTTYLWSPVTGLSNVNISNPIANPSNTTTYSIKVTDANGCSNTNSTTVTINPLPTISITPNSGICNGSNIQLSASGGTSYTWSPSTGLNNIAISNPIASPSNTTSYSVTVTDANGCTNNASTTISVNPFAVVTVSPNTAICAGNNTQLTASSALTYSWSPSTGLSNANISNPIANPPATTTYTLNITDANGCTGSGSVTITVNTLPVATVSPSAAICSGASTQLSASGGTTYSWSPSSGLNNSGINNPVANPSSTTTYSVKVTDANGCSNTISTTVTINPLPTVTITPNSGICNGSNIQLSASGGTNYAWSPSTGLNNTAISNPIATPSSTTSYSVIVTDANGCTNNASTTISVNPLAVVTVSPDAAICAGNNTQLTASAASTYSWSPAGAGLSNTNISNPVATPSSTTTYTLNITDANGCTGSGSVTVTVNPLPVATVNSSTAICSGASYQLSASGGTTYLWSPATGLSNVNLSNPIANPSSTTTYSIKVTDANGCSNTVSTTVTINPLPTITITPNSGICNGSNIQLSASGGTSYTWSPSPTLSNTAISNPIASPSSTTSYSVTVTDANSCTNNASTTISVNSFAVVTVSPNSAICAGNNTQLTASAASTYSWSPATGLSNASISNPVANPSSTTTYTLNITDSNGCTGSSSVTVTVNPLPIATVSPSAAICFGATTQLSASGGTTYLWNPSTGLNNANINNPVANPSSTTPYSVLVTDANGCSANAAVTITVNPLPVVSASPNSAICNGANVQLTASGGTNYSWSPTTGLNNSSISNPLASPSSTTPYSVIVSNANGCSANATVSITVNPVPVLTVSPDAAICNGSNTQLTASSTGTVTYTWSPATGLNNPNISNPVATPSATTSYTLNVNDANGCTAAATVTVTVNPLPVIISSPTNTTCNGTNNGADSVSASGSSPFTYLWSNGGTQSSISNLTPQTYIVTVTDINGCTATATATITQPQPIVLNFKRDYYICDEGGNGVTLTASGGTSYLWSPSTGLSDSTIANPVAHPFVTTTYTLTVSNGACSDTALVTVNLVPLPTPPNIVEHGDSLFVPTGYAGYQWYYDGSPISGANNYFYVVTQNGFYSVYLTDTIGCEVVTSSVNVVITSVTSPLLNNDGISIFPNPVIDWLKVVGLSKAFNMEIYNAIGQKVYGEDYSENPSPNDSETINVSNLSAGVYFLTLTGEKIRLTTKFVKQ